MNLEEIEIILVEDNPDDAFFTKRAFQDANVNNAIITITDGEDAINFFFNNEAMSDQTFKGKSKLILLDMNLPKVNGMKILEELKTHDRTKNIPVVILTSTDDDPTMQKAFDLGAEDYIVKPVTFEGFVKVVTKLSDKLK
jgi:two-component system, response regulator